MNNIEVVLQQLLGVDDAKRMASEQQITDLEQDPALYFSSLISVGFFLPRE